MLDLKTTIKRSVQQLPLPLFFPCYAAWHWIRHHRYAERARRKGAIPFLATDANNLRRSDTVFILGSGSSINSISAKRWDRISQHDTIGLNHWLLHPFVPTFYCFESFSREPNLAASYDLLLNGIRSRAVDYAHTIKLVVNLDRGTQLIEEVPPQWRESLYFAWTPPVVARTEAEFRASLHFHRMCGLFNRKACVKSLFKYNSNLVTCISLAILLGHRRIVLCGVDLCNSEYFYHDPVLFPQTAHVTIGPRERVHDTAVPLPWLVPIDRVLVIIRDEVLQPLGIQLFIESDRSLLYPSIDHAPDYVFSTVAT